MAGAAETGGCCAARNNLVGDAGITAKKSTQENVIARSVWRSRRFFIGRQSISAFLKGASQRIRSSRLPAGRFRRAGDTSTTCRKGQVAFLGDDAIADCLARTLAASMKQWHFAARGEVP